MKQRSIPLLLVTCLSILFVSCGYHGPASNAADNTSNSGTSLAAGPSATPAATSTKEVDIVAKYRIEIPKEFTVQELLSSPITTVPAYNFETPTGSAFSIFVHPYMVSSSPVQGKCVVSTALDGGTASAPVFCEGLELSRSFAVPSGWTVKYGNSIHDLSLDCTMNSPCPVNVPPDARYAVSYVFVVADKPRATTLEFYAGDAFRGASSEVSGFEGLAAILRDLVIPSLTVRNP